MAMHQITDHIWVGSMMSLTGEKTLQKNNVTHILSVLDIRAMGQNAERFRSSIKEKFQHLHIEIDDVEDVDIMQYFPATNAFIDEAVGQGKSVLIHCIAGISRSVTMAAAYIMRENKWKPEETIEFIRTKRSIANPNSSFVEQLQVYYQSGYEVSLDKKPYREWKLKHQSQEFGYQGVSAANVNYTPVESAPLTLTWRHLLPALVDKQIQLNEIIRVVINGDPHAPTEPIRGSLKTVESEVQVIVRGKEPITITPEKLSEVIGKVSTQKVTLRCKGCSSTLATSGSFVGHEKGTAGLCQHHFVEPIEWMRTELEKGELEGKLLCQKCNHKLGSYQWQGSQCSCGSWIIPSFKIQKSRVDEMAVRKRESVL